MPCPGGALAPVTMIRAGRDNFMMNGLFIADLP
jgi:hypothetical protein